MSFLIINSFRLSCEYLFWFNLSSAFSFENSKYLFLFFCAKSKAVFFSEKSSFFSILIAKIKSEDSIQTSFWILVFKSLNVITRNAGAVELQVFKAVLYFRISQFYFYFVQKKLHKKVVKINASYCLILILWDSPSSKWQN